MEAQAVRGTAENRMGAAAMSVLSARS